MEQLLLSALPAEDAHDLYTFQAKMLHGLIEFYLEMNRMFKKQGYEAG